MNHYLVEVDILFDADTAPEAIDEIVDALAEALAGIGGGIDGDVSASLRRRVVTIHLSIDDESDEGAFARGVAAARTAIHAAGGPTAGWEKITLQRSGDQLVVG